MLKEFSRCSIFLVLFIYLGISAVFIYMAANFISSYENLKGLRVECENCGVKLISILITIGILALTFILFGCLGACRHKKPIKKFLMLFFVLFCLEIAGGLLIYINRYKIRSNVRENMTTTFTNYKEETVQTAIDYLQRNVPCCGVDSPSDWSHYGFKNTTLPKSCCSPIDIHEKCTMESTHHKNFKTGCYTKISNVFTQNSIFLFILVGVFFLIQLFGLSLGLYLSCTTKSLTS